MYFIQYLKEIAEQMGLEFYHGPKSFQNLQDQVKKTIPLKNVCYLHFPIAGTTPRKKQGFGETKYSIELLIAGQSQVNWEMVQQFELIAAMENISHSFMNNLLNHQAIHEVSDYAPVEVINIFDMNLSGVIITTIITPFDRRSNCG